MEQDNINQLTDTFGFIFCRRALKAPWPILHWAGGNENPFGYKKTSFLSKAAKGFASWIHQEDKHNVASVLETALAQKTNFSLVYRIQQKNGQYVSVFENGHIVWNGAEALYTESLINILPEKIPTLPQRENNKYKQILDHSSDGILIHKNYITLEVNNTFCEMFGWSADEIIGKEIMSQIIKRGNDPQITAILERLKADAGLAYENILWFKHKDGSLIYVNVTASTIKIEGEELRLVVFRNVTKEIQTREDFFSSNQRYQTLLSGSSEGIVIHDKGIAIEVSPRFCEIVGRKAEELLGMPVINLVPPEEKPKIVQFLRENQENFQNIRKEKTKAEHSSGKVFDIELWGNSIEINGKGYRYVIIRDISEERDAERKLEQSRQKYKRLSDITDEIVLVHDNGLIIEVNRAACEHYRRPEEQLIGAYTFDLLSPKMIKEYNLTKETLEQTYKSDKVSDGIVIEEIEGEQLYMRYKESIFYLNGRKLRYVVMRNITTEFVTQKKLEESNAKYKRLIDVTREGVIIHKNGKIVEVNPAVCELFGHSEENLIGMFMGDLADNIGGAEQLHSITSGSSAKIDRILLRKSNGENFIAELWESNIETGGEIYRYTVVRDMTERIRYEQRIEELVYNLTEKNKQINCLLDLARLSVQKDHNLDEMMEEALQVIPKGWQYPEVCAVAIEYGAKNWQHPRFKESNPWVLEAPIIIDGVICGKICVSYIEACPPADEGPFLQAERALIDALGVQIAMLIEKKLSEDRVIASVLETEDRERTRIAKELHDSLGQVLMAVSLNLESLKKEITALSDKNQTKLTNALHYLGHAIQESRELAHNLMPKAIGDYGYVLAVGSMLEQLCSDEVSFHFYDNLEGERLPNKMELALFRITQEAVTNILRHAAAQNITIQLMKYSDMLILTIEDDGKGFEFDAKDYQQFFGLNGMRNRAHSISGIFTLESKPGYGTTLMIEAPL